MFVIYLLLLTKQTLSTGIQPPAAAKDSAFLYMVCPRYQVSFRAPLVILSLWFYRFF